MAQHTSTGRDDIVEWGTDDELRPGWLAALSNRLGIRDRHLVVTVAAAGAGLSGLSLLTHWQVTTLTDQRPPVRLETSVAGLEAWGSGYLLGLLGLVALTATTLYGAPSQRRQLRIAGLAWGGALLGVLVAVAINLDMTSVFLRYSFFSQDPEYELSYGPGVFLALAGVACVTTALHLVRRLGDVGSASAGREAVGSEKTSGGEPERRPSGTARGPASPVPNSNPIDLTVSPATPFVHLPEHR